MAKGFFMKKYILCFFAAILVAACTSPEDDAKIQAYWATQYMHLMARLAGSPLMNSPLATQGLASFTQKDAEQEFASLVPPENATEPDQAELEEMMKQWQESQDQVEEQATVPAEEAPAPTAPVTPKKKTSTSAKTNTSPVNTGVTKKNKPIEALLVVSSSCGWCHRLKQDRWAEKFRDKYWGQIKLIEYDVNSSADRTLYNKFLRKHKLTSVGTPTLFIGDAKISGYPLPGADEAAQKAIAKYGTPAEAAKQYMEITMEEPAGPVRGKAPLKDRQAMQRAIEKVQQDNEKILQDIGQMFGNSTQTKAFAITSNTEKTLRQKASASSSLQSYLTAQKQILAQQERSLNKLMQENAHLLRNIK